MEMQETQNKVVFAGMQIKLLSIHFLSSSPMSLDIVKERCKN
jgi:hypothetical protein